MMKIHDVIFVIHLKQTFSNSNVKIVFLFLLLSIDDNELYIVEKIIRREQKNCESKYRVK